MKIPIAILLVFSGSCCRKVLLNKPSFYFSFAVKGRGQGGKIFGQRHFKGAVLIQETIGGTGMSDPYSIPKHPFQMFQFP